jgi:hypothetical protein
MQLNSIHEPVRLENERTYLQLKPELRQTLYIGAWAITAVMGVGGVTTYYSTNPTALGAVMAFLLFLGFMLTMKSASALLFDAQMGGFIRFLALLCVIAVVIIDVFAFSHDKQTGVMERIESSNAVDAGYASKTERIQQLQATSVSMSETTSVMSVSSSETSETSAKMSETSVSSKPTAIG